MKTNAPTSLTLLISIILGGLGIVGRFITIPFVTANLFWFLTAGFVLLVLGCILRKF